MAPLEERDAALGNKPANMPNTDAELVGYVLDVYEASDRRRAQAGLARRADTGARRSATTWNLPSCRFGLGHALGTTTGSA